MKIAQKLLWAVLALLLAGCAAEASGAEPDAARAPKPAADRSPAVGPTTADLAFAVGKPIALPPPRATGGAPLMRALAERRSTREYKPDPLPLALLSDLLWAAGGVNRRETGKRTAPTAMNRQDLDIYAATARGLFRYDPASHALVPIRPGDLRAVTGKQPFVGTAPVNLVYVSNLARMEGVEDGEDRLVYAGSHAGFVAENVYLFAASAGLATVVRGYFDRPALTAAIGLGPTERVILAQTVGYPGGNGAR